MTQTKRNPAAVPTAGLLGNCQDAKLTGPRFKPARNEKQLLSELARARQHLEDRTFVLEHIIAWRDTLRERIWQAKARFEFCDCSTTNDDLIGEVADFALVCRTIGWSPSARRPS